MKKIGKLPTTTTATRQTRKTKYDELISTLANNLNDWFELGEEDISSPTIEPRRVRVHQIARQRGLSVTTHRDHDHLYVMCTAAPAKTLVKSVTPLSEEFDDDRFETAPSGRKSSPPKYDGPRTPDFEVLHSQLSYAKIHDPENYQFTLLCIHKGHLFENCDCKSKCEFSPLPEVTNA